ncbi:uncharacterized protein LOC126614059 isoform X1 [Malus sylvestris]|uniref:uncharacterized protein LOC126614059 isoform X1 n=2 Tax=Malus sylvestris TaxID=3752 RepID=UPI0021AD3FCA|nr:uncharacterized protein LOC126614059 isoform X1 [Malus sylvestris]
MAAAGAAADGLFRCVYEGCLSELDIGVERRPYHRNCGCALHNKSPNKQCTHGGPKSKKVSYPLRRAWSEGNLALVASAGSSVHSSPSSSPAKHHYAVGRLHQRRQSHQQLDTLCDEDEEEDEEENVLFKVLDCKYEILDPLLPCSPSKPNLGI